VITLHRAAALSSRVKEVLLYCSCSHTTTCQTRRCKCFKSGAKCTNYCHKRKHHPDDQAGSCLNLAAPEARNMRTLISRGIPPTSLTSTLSLSPLSLSPVSTPLPSASSSTLASPTSEFPTVHAPQAPLVPGSNSPIIPGSNSPIIPGSPSPIIHKCRSSLLSAFHLSVNLCLFFIFSVCSY